jgi:hypothetical protein
MIQIQLIDVSKNELTPIWSPIPGRIPIDICVEASSPERSTAQAGTLSAAAKTLHQRASTISWSLTRLESIQASSFVRRSPKGPCAERRGEGISLILQTSAAMLSDGGELLESHHSSPRGIIKIAYGHGSSRRNIRPKIRRATAEVRFSRALSYLQPRFRQNTIL